MIPGLFGAERRLLHPLVPVVFFGCAVVAQGLFWLLLALNPEAVIGAAGGLGPALGLVHVLTLGVLILTAVGATVQILPVVTLQSAPSLVVGLVLALPLVTAAVLLPLGFFRHDPSLLLAGTLAAALGLAAYGTLVFRLLRRAGRETLPGVRGFLILALVSLGGFALLALALAGNYILPHLADPAPLALAHLILAGFGVMGCLAVGFSHVLVPMLTMAVPPSSAEARPTLALTGAALGLAVVGAVLEHGPLLVAATLLALAASLAHLRLMVALLNKRMRKRLPWGFWLIRAAWGLLPATLIQTGSPPDASAPVIRARLEDAARVLEDDVTTHFHFEESHLFPILEQAGAGFMVSMLKGEHEVIRPLAQSLRDQALSAIAAGAFSMNTWTTFRQTAGELIERELFHVQKEEMGLLAALAQVLDPSLDARLVALHGALREAASARRAE